RLRVQRFESGNAGADGSAIPLLPDGTTSSGELHDLELFSYWIVVDARTPTLLLEARGRTLTSMTVWRDGSWDTGARPAAAVVEIEKGKPLTVLELNLDLTPGAYLVTCAGGAARQWATDSPERPFSITRGARYLGETGRMSVTLPPERTVSFLVSAGVDSVEMMVPNADDYRLETSAFTQGGGRHSGVRAATITPKSASLRCAVRGSTGGSRLWVTVQGPAGRTVELVWLDTAQSGTVVQPYRETGKYLTTVLSSLDGDDSIDATGMILQRNVNPSPPDMGAVQALTFSPEQPLHRTVNAIGPFSFIAQPLKRGSYSVAEKDKDGATALYTFSLLDDQFTPGREVHPLEVKGGGRVDLIEKLYLVTVRPVKAGVLDFAIVPANLIGRPKTGGVFSVAAPAPRGDFCWPSTSIAQYGGWQSYLVLGQRQGVLTGVCVRKLPLDLRQSVALRVEPGATVSVPFDNREDTVLSSTNAAFTSSTAVVDGSPWRPDRVVPAGPRTITITNRTSAPQWHVLSAAPPDPTSGAARPTVQAPETLLPVLAEGAVAWRSFARGESVGYLLKVEEPGSYRVTTSGRLSMGITIRTPLIPMLLASRGWVDGQNAELTAYLRRGT
ncbi:MAG TPA: hypothetical protein VHE79_06000, partial [Spirochaetia bacterium]